MFEVILYEYLNSLKRRKSNSYFLEPLNHPVIVASLEQITNDDISVPVTSSTLAAE
jgi:hypothetical protein